VKPTILLYSVAVGLVLLGLAANIGQAPPTHVDGAQLVLPIIGERRPALAGASADETFAPIVAANIFSPTRRAPARVSPVEHAIHQAVGHTGPRAPTLTLYGTTVGPQGAVALIQGDGMNPGADVYHVGDVVAGARLVAITDSTVTLARPSGALVLRLQPAEGRKKL